MAEIALQIFLYVGIAVIYVLALIATTMLSIKIRGIEYADDIDYAMTANVIQFFMMVVVIAEKVAQWMK